MTFFPLRVSVRFATSHASHVSITSRAIISQLFTAFLFRHFILYFRALVSSRNTFHNCRMQRFSQQQQRKQHMIFCYFTRHIVISHSCKVISYNRPSAIDILSNTFRISALLFILVDKIPFMRASSVQLRSAETRFPLDRHTETR